MPTLSVTKTYLDGTILFEADLDNIVSDIESFLNSTKIDNSNIQDAGIDAASKLVDASISAAKLASSAVTTTKIADDAVTTAKILAANVTTAKIADSNVTTAKIADSNVTTAKIADGNVTPAKLAALGQQISSSCGAYSTSSGSYADVTNLSISITTTGRPVFVGLIADGDLVNPHYISGTSNSTASYVSIVRASTEVSMAWIGAAKQPLSSVWHIDTPSAGTYTYKVRALSSNTLEIAYAKLIAFEL